MITKGLRNLLDGLNLLDSQAVFFLKKEDGPTFIFPSTEMRKKLDIIKPTAYYVFNNQPYILFFDITENIEREDEIHKQVWSFDQSPLVFVIKETDVEIYNAFDYNKKQNRLQEIKLKNGEDKNVIFSFWNLQSGAAWTWLQERFYKNTIQKKRVNQKLFENIKLVRETLTNTGKENSLCEEDANILILRLIFIRYLIDRNVKLDEEFINGNSIFERKKSFIDLIEKPRKLNELFAKLNEKFHGVLFQDIKIQLSKVQAKSLALVFSGEKPERGTIFYGADFYFEIFDFSIIPVEVISGIYESLIDEDTRDSHSAVYTPSFLVEYILTNTIDEHYREKKNKNKAECKIFDPSVGSGIFLVQAFRRMVDREISLNNEAKITKVRLREIAQNNLFGIDINEQALKVTCFSIYIAILDYQDPKTILDNFHFPQLLDENLFNANFFDTSHVYNDTLKLKELDFILGNPPWKSNKEEVHANWLASNNVVVGRFEIAQSFLLRSKDFMQVRTKTALIVTSTIFYNISTPTKKFKQEFLTQFCIDSFFDLSPVRRLIFEEKNSPCSIVFYHLSDGQNHLTNVIKHSSIKSNTFLKYYKTIVIEKFDQKKIQQKHFIANDWMFKVALYGNTLDFLLIKKLEQNDTRVRDLIDGKTIFKGAGIKSNKGKDYAEFLIGLPLLENAEIREFYTPVARDQKKLSAKDVYYESGRKKELFVGSKILIKEQARNESELVISYSDKTCVYKNGIWGISSMDDSSIKLLFSYLITELYTYYIYITSCSWGVATRPQIRLEEEYLSFPIIKAEEQANMEMISLVTKLLSPYKEFYKKFNLGAPLMSKLTLNKINELIEDLYNINGYEKDLINYVLTVSRYQFQESKQDKIIRKVHGDKNVLLGYAQIFLDEFKRIYEDEYIHVNIFPLNHFIAMNFIFKKEKPTERINILESKDYGTESEIFSTIAKSVSISQITKDLYVQKDIKGFEENSFYIIKPNEFKCWHKAMAWYDVAEIKEAIQSSELERQTKQS